MYGARGESGVFRNSTIRFVRLAGEQIYYAPSFHDRQSSWYVLLLIYYGHMANRTNFFNYHYLVIIQATSSINIHVERLITISAELSTVYDFLV